MLIDGPVSTTTSIMNSDSTSSIVVVAAHTLDDTDIEMVSAPQSSGQPHQSGVTNLPPPQQPPPHGGIIDFHDPPDTKEGIEELCPVCGDKVSGYHYGLLTCESCKGFFKRTVQNKKVYTCVADRTCHIDKSQRKRCPYCRFQKCLAVGMKLEAVRADRMRGGRNKFGPMYKRDRARKLQAMRQKQIVRAQCQGVGNEVVPCPPTPFQLTHPPSSPSVYANDPHIKQELIQIPQLSSSTSSPDSSPSPLCTSVQSSISAVTAQFPLAVTLSGAPPLPLPSAATVPSAQESPSKTSGAVLPWHSVPPPSPHPHHQQQQPQPHQHNATTTTTNNNNGSPLSPKCYNSHAAYADSLPSVLNTKLPPLVREFLSTMPDDKEWQSQLFSLLQNQTYNQCEVDLFELMCKVIDQSLFAQVDWARNSIFFKDLKVDDQMKLLQHSWSDMLILDHLHQRLHNGLPEETTMPNGQKFDLVTLALLGIPNMLDQLHNVSARLQELKFDQIDYICLKFLLLMNPGDQHFHLFDSFPDRSLHLSGSSPNPTEVRSISNMKLVHEAFEQTQQALLEYTLTVYPQVTDKFTQLLQLLPEIHLISERGEDFLLFRHLNGNAPTQTLLMEMLHAKKK